MYNGPFIHIWLSKGFFMNEFNSLTAQHPMKWKESVLVYRKARIFKTKQYTEYNKLTRQENLYWIYSAFSASITKALRQGGVIINNHYNAPKVKINPAMCCLHCNVLFFGDSEWRQVRLVSYLVRIQFDRNNYLLRKLRTICKIVRRVSVKENSYIAR